jgi:cell wall-associated NlpC family hydrolase
MRTSPRSQSRPTPADATRRPGAVAARVVAAAGVAAAIGLASSALPAIAAPAPPPATTAPATTAPATTAPVTTAPSAAGVSAAPRTSPLPAADRVAHVTPGATPAMSNVAATPFQNSTPYYEASPTGAVWPLGGATNYGQLPAGALFASNPVVSITLTPNDGGYWLLTAAGRVFNYGNASFLGSPAHSGLRTTVTGLTSTPDGRGYWVWTSTGHVYNYGDAVWYGSPEGRVSSPLVAMTLSPDGHGYWLAAASGAVDAYGDAHSYGQLGGVHLNAPIVSIARTADGRGYWLVGSDGGVFTFGDAVYHGGFGGAPINQPTQALVPTGDGNGYWLVTHDGDIHAFGDATSDATPVLAFVHTVSTAGDRAVEWAMAQLGKPYQWGGTGPDSFDCSGLTMMSWRAAGVTIPRIADEQYSAGPNVSMTNLVDGDLVFWADNTSDPSTIYHVGMYIGGGHMVDAPYTGAYVRTDWIGGYQFVPEGTAP